MNRRNLTELCCVKTLNPYFDCREWEVIDNDRPLKSSVVSWPVYVEDRVPDSRSTAKRLDPNRVDGSYKFGKGNYNGISHINSQNARGSGGEGRERNDLIL